MTPPGPRTLALLLVLALLWGGAFLLIKIAVQTIPPGWTAAGRIFVALAVVGAIVLVVRKRLPSSPALWLRLSGLGLFGIALPFLLQNFAETRIDSSDTAILIALTPLWTLLLAHFFTADEKLTARKLTGVALGFVGVLALVNRAPGLAGLELSWAHLLAVAAAASYAVNIVLCKRTNGVPVDVMTLGALIWAAVLIGGFVLAWEPAAEVAPSWGGVAAVAALGLGSTAAAAYLSFLLIRSAGAQLVALNIYMIPVVGVVLGNVFLDEPVTWRTAMSSLLILVGIGVATLSGWPRGGRLRIAAENFWEVWATTFARGRFHGTHVSGPVGAGRPGGRGAGDMRRRSHSQRR